MLKPIIIATLVAGTLDILSAFGFAGMAGVSSAKVAQFIASGPFGEGGRAGGAGWAIAGMVVHYAIMACMVAAYIVIARRFAPMLKHPIAAGAVYGILLWLVMYWIVRPTRWPALWLPDAWATKNAPEIAWTVGAALFSHYVLVGIPIALIAAYSLRPKRG